MPHGMIETPRGTDSADAPLFGQNRQGQVELWRLHGILQAHPGEH